MAKGKTIWVLTEEHNDYNQHGEYFVAAFERKPTIDQLVNFFEMEKSVSIIGGPMEALSFILHLFNGGGRRAQENHWFNLSEVEFGKRAD